MGSEHNPIVDVAVDAMGGDRAPEVPVEASLRAIERGVRVALVGDEGSIRAHLDRLGVHGALPAGLILRHAPESIGMDEKPSHAIRKKRGSSMRVAAEMVAAGEARAIVSAGNSGAVMAAGLFSIGRIRGVQRPAIASAFPTRRQKVVMLDLGANIDPTPVQLAQFAIMGEAYARTVLGRSRPRVALLANGAEETKGSDLTRAALAILKKAPDLNLVGYCEGRDIFDGEIDVIATDGFTGNVLLKTLEGFVLAARDIVEKEVRSSFAASAGALLMRDILKKVKKKLDYEDVGAAPLLGLKERCLVAHGASTVNALTNAITHAISEAGSTLTASIAEAIERGAANGLWPIREEDASPPAATVDGLGSSSDAADP